MPEPSSFREMLSLVPAAIVTDIAGRINFANARAAELTGREASSLIGLTWADLLVDPGPLLRTGSLPAGGLPPEAGPGRATGAERTGGGEGTVRGRLRLSGAGTREVRVGFAVRPGPDGERISVLHPVEGGRAIERDAQRVRALLLAYPDLVFRIGSDARFLDCSAGEHEERLLAPPSVFLGRRVQDVLPPVLGEQLLQSIERVRQGAPYDTFEYRIDRGGATEIWEARVVPSGRDEVIVVSRETTGLRRLDDAVREAGAAEQRRIARELHDGLGQQLTGIVLRASAVEDRAQSDPEVAAEILRIRRDLSIAIDELRRLAGGLVPPALHRGSLGDAIHGLASHLEREHGIEAKLSLAFPAIPSESARIGLYHLIRDAVVAAVETGRARRIFLSVQATPERLEITLEDDGDCPLGGRATSPYDRVRHQVRRMAGYLVLEDAVPRGARMVCHLPRVLFAKVPGGA